MSQWFTSIFLLEYKYVSDVKNIAQLLPFSHIQTQPVGKAGLASWQLQRMICTGKLSQYKQQSLLAQCPAKCPWKECSFRLEHYPVTMVHNNEIWLFDQDLCSSEMVLVVHGFDYKTKNNKNHFRTTYCFFC